MKHIYLLLSGLLIIPFLSFSQPINLVKDINTLHSGAGAPSELVTYNGYVYFIQDDGTNGAEVWRTDGTTTEQFTDIDNQTFGDPFSLIVWNSNLYFSTNVSGTWKSDGTTENTEVFTSVKGKIIPGENVVYIYDNSTAQSLSVSDGLFGGSFIRNMSSNIPNREMVVVGDDIYFVDMTTETGKEVYFVDITDTGDDFSSTVTVLDNIISGTVSSEPANLTAFNGKCYWVSLKTNTNGNGTGPKGLYESDGSLVGTTEFFTFDTNVFNTMHGTTTGNIRLATINGKLMYYNVTGNPQTTNNIQLFSYDGITPPASPLQTFPISTPIILQFYAITFNAVIDGNLYFSLLANSTKWYTDGSTVTSTAVNTGLFTEYEQLDEVILYSSYGSPSNTSNPLYAVNLTGAVSTVYDYTATLDIIPHSFAVLGGEMFFVASDDTEGIQIWKTDGTGGNTSRVTTSSFDATKSSSPENFFTFNEELYFTATGNGSYNLYKTDGSEENTVEVINSTNTIKGGGVTFDDAYFFADNNILKKMDGASITTVSTLEITISNLMVAGSHLFFTSTSTGEGTELWVSDGLTTEVLDLFPGASFSSSPDQLVDVNGVLYFRAIDPDEGTKGLWKSEGTLETTEVVFSDIIGDVHEFKVIGENIFLTVDDLFIGEELKVYNTTSEEITKVDLLEGSGDAFPEHLTPFNGYLYLTYQQTYNYQVLLKLDPTDLTTSIIAYMNVTQLADNYSYGFITTSSFLSFYVSDYTTSYSKRVTVSKNDNISYPTDNSPSWQNAVAIDDIVYYEYSGTLYESDGISSKEVGSLTGGKISFNDFLYFSHDDGSLGFEPHKYASTRQGFNLTGSTEIQFTQEEAQLDLTWTPGTGDGRLVIASSGAYLDLSDIVDGEVYPSDPMYGNGATSIAAGETYFTSHLVASGDVSEVSVTDLSPGQKYYFTIIEYEEIGVDDFKYDLQGAITESFQLEKIDQTITFENPGETLATTTVTLDAVSTSGLVVSYQVSGPAFISGSNLTFNGSGEVTLTLNQSGNANYNPAEELVIVFDVVKDEQIITFEMQDEATFLDDPITFTSAVNSAGISLNYAITGPGQLNIAHDQVTITGAGTIEVTVSNDGNGLYEPVSVTETIIVAKADHTLTLGSIEDKPYNTTFSLLYGVDLDIMDSAPPGSATGSIIVSIVSGPAEVNPTNQQEVTITGIGTVTYEVSNGGNDNYNPAPTVEGSFEAVKADQTITLNGTIPTEIAYGDGSFSFENKLITQSGSASLIVIEGPGFFNGEDMNIYNITGTGQVTISAFANSNEFYNGSLPIEITFEVIKSNQTITFDGITDVTNVNNIIYTPEGYELNAHSSSGLEVAFSITLNSESGSLDDNLLTVTSAGQFQITMSQPGNENYNAASNVIQSINISKADQTITVEEIPNKVKGADAFPIIASSSAGLELTYTITNRQGVTLNGNTATINNQVLSGQTTIEINCASTPVYNAANPVTISFCISPQPPVLTMANNIISSNNLLEQHEWYADGEFLQVSSNSNNTFTPTESGEYKALARAEDGCPSSSFSNIISFEKTVLGGLRDETKAMIYPVPARDYLNVSPKLLLNKNYTFEIFDLSGKRRIAGELTDQLDITPLTTGVYYLRLLEKDLKTTTDIPFIKE